MTVLKIKGKKCPNSLLAISFFYTIFGVYILDFTTIYGIIDRLSLKNGHNMLCYLLQFAQDIVIDRYIQIKKTKEKIGLWGRRK